jgi:hypothetical protein
MIIFHFQHSCHHHRSHHITGDCCPGIPASRIEVGLRGRARPQRQLSRQRAVSGPEVAQLPQAEVQVAGAHLLCRFPRFSPLDHHHGKLFRFENEKQNTLFNKMT